MKRHVSVLLIVVALAALAWLYLLPHEPAPRAVVGHLQEAVAQRDVEAFQQHVDLEKVVGRFVDDASEREGHDGSLLALFMPVAQLKSQLVEEVRGAVLRQVEDGALLRTVEPPHALRSLGIDLDHRPRVVGTRREGNMAYLQCEYRHARLDETFPLVLQVRLHEGHWQIIEIANATALLDAIEQAKEAAVAAANEARRARLAELLAVEVLGVERAEQSGMLGTRKVFAVRLRLRNGGEHAIERFKVLLTIGAGDRQFEEPETDFDAIAPGATVERVWHIGLVADAAEPIYSAEQPVQARVELQELELADGTSLALYEDYRELPAER